MFSPAKTPQSPLMMSRGHTKTRVVFVGRYFSVHLPSPACKCREWGKRTTDQAAQKLRHIGSRLCTWESGNRLPVPRFGKTDSRWRQAPHRSALHSERQGGSGPNQNRFRVSKTSSATPFHHTGAEIPRKSTQAYSTG